MTALRKADDPATFASEVTGADVPVVVDFWAEWCLPCQTVAAELQSLAAKYEGTVRFVKVDVEANTTIAEEYGIRGVPTIALFEAGEITRELVGARPRQAIEYELGLTRFAATAG
jgi:thioredoxin